MSFCPKWLFEAACGAAAADFLSTNVDLNTVASSYAAVLEELIKLKPSIDNLFDSVMVMDSDLNIRNNRLSLLRSISSRFLNIACNVNVTVIRDAPLTRGSISSCIRYR